MHLYATVSGATVNFANFPLTLPGPIDTLPANPSGQIVLPDIDIEARVNAAKVSWSLDMTFGSVTTGGVTTVTSSPIGPAPPPGFELEWADGYEGYDHAIHTTAGVDWSQGVKLCFDDGNAFDAHPGLADTLQIMRWSGMGWDPPLERESTAEPHTLCGVTTSFSVFALMFEPSLWTGKSGNGACCNAPLLRFDLSFVPPEAVVTSAGLALGGTAYRGPARPAAGERRSHPSSFSSPLDT